MREIGVGLWELGEERAALMGKVLEVEGEG